MAGLLRGYQGDIDALAPPHKLSTRLSQSSRGIFAIGAVSAEAVAKRLENQKRIDQFRRRA